MLLKRMRWRIFLSFLLVTLLTLTAVTCLDGTLFERFYRQDALKNLEQSAWILASQMLPLVADEAATDRLCKELGGKADRRITVVHASGKVLGDSLERPEHMANHADRPEIRQALEGGVGRQQHFSQTLHEEMLYVAVPVQKDGTILAAVRAAKPLGQLRETFHAVYKGLACIALAAAALTALVSLWLARRFTRPLDEIGQGLKYYAEGRFDQKISVPGTLELAQVARGMNVMSAHLNDRIRTIERQRNEQQAVLTSMREGVLALDAEERILFLNDSARLQLHIPDVLGAGRNLQEAVRNSEVQRLAAAVLKDHRDAEGEINLRDGDAERFLQVRATALRDAASRPIGVLLVLNDITRLRHLETVRRDFVANVSHELKTPVTAIKGYVETLLDGAMQDPADQRRFLGIISRQSERLNAIIEDLLLLSRLEGGDAGADVEKTENPLRKILDASTESCAVLANEKNIALEIKCAPELAIQCNPVLLEDAVTNLVNNAIRYSKPNTRVQIEAAGNPRGGAAIRVRDQGCGISKEHLPRLFERFYRVDKARSRQQGGTGLGLSIVKHIVHLHGGTLQVESEPGKGSLFEILLP